MTGSLQNKILQFEQAPPSAIWDRIAGELDADTALKEQCLAFRMQDTEVAPPPQVWEQIAGILNQENNTKVVSINRNRNWVRWAAAAAVLALIATVAIWMAQPAKPADQTAASHSNTEPVTPAPGTQPPAVTAPVADQAQNIAAVQPVPVTKQKPVTAPEYEKPDATDISSSTDINTLAKNDELKNDRTDAVSNMDLAVTPHTYITITGPDGQEVRVSSKFSKMIGLLDEKDPASAEYLDKIIKESGFWREKFKKWREQLLNNSSAPSLSNFMDILETNTILTENKKP